MDFTVQTTPKQCVNTLDALPGMTWRVLTELAVFKNNAQNLKILSRGIFLFIFAQLKTA